MVRFSARPAFKACCGVDPRLLKRPGFWPSPLTGPVRSRIFCRITTAAGNSFAMAKTAETVALSIAPSERCGYAGGSAVSFDDWMQSRRTVRDFSSEPVDPELIRIAVRTAGTAPSGANQQPWSFVAIGDPDTKRAIRLAAEEEERTSMKAGPGMNGSTRSPRLGRMRTNRFLKQRPG
jgi:iodotyrosine deiodinase